MNELDVQSWIVKTVRDDGGAAHKLSNRFLVGVSDLLVKLRGRPAALIEVKFDRRAGLSGPPVHLDVTVPQQQFLRNYQQAGMVVRVLSALEIGHKGIKGLHIYCSRLDALSAAGFYVSACRHAHIGNHTSRDELLIQTLREACNEL